ncbi:cob(I)yrinic acid a,c-diamide adenosyltransferase [Thermicanus aegyptius]|uniref:cob(I)yrinic acid a,c-diamide adenosyltransferase n=1 Tax=Thermicanus aegyptius TaxID=94009 RepID=UPI0004040B9F|nr:cob(I)yrinic acid a,c-diamide adenosyltransferase [Thermicanus aegyptius]
MKIYTKSGDKGETSLNYGIRVPKDDLRVEAYGTVDEANSFVGLALSLLPETGGDPAELERIRHGLKEIQTKLFHIGAELSTPEGKEVPWPIREEDVAFLEQEIDLMEEKLPPLAQFILPGGHPASASLHAARTVVRRAERRVVSLSSKIPLQAVVVRYLNRLSDYLFVAARWVNHLAGIPDAGLHEINKEVGEQKE